MTVREISEQVAVGLRPFLSWQTLKVLFKVRVVGLLLFAAVAGAFLGAGGWPGIGDFLALIVVGGLSAAGSSAINEYLERDRDALMRRTRHRPLVVGLFPYPIWVPVIGAAMILVPSFAVVFWNPALTFFVLLGAFIYVVIYTIWLKPRTLLNIVIGGAAGSAAVMSGGAAVGAWSDPGVIVLALLVFLWTPIHFWSLALACRDDYSRAGVPMLPVHTTPLQAALWSLLHGGAAALAGLLLIVHPALGWVYGVLAVIGSALLVGQGVRLVRRPDRGNAWLVFHASNLYLSLILLAICVDTLLPL